MPEAEELSPEQSADTRAKWRRQFEKQGRDEVRRQMNAGATYFNASSRTEAKAWLRDKERESDEREQWTFRLTVAVLTLTIIGFALVASQALP
jgi:hypothetical protein